MNANQPGSSFGAREFLGTRQKSPATLLHATGLKFVPARKFQRAGIVGLLTGIAIFTTVTFDASALVQADTIYLANEPKAGESDKSQAAASTQRKITVAEPAEAEFTSIFDGTTLKGWDGDPNWFRIENGVIIAGSLTKDVPHNYFLCTKETYSDFDLRLEVKLRGKGDNAGVQFRSKRMPQSTEVSGYQGDVGKAWNRNVWGWLYDESRRNKVLAEGNDEVISKALRADDWNELRILAMGPKIEIFLNGVPTVTFVEDDETIPTSGVIGLQIHSGPPTEALYRNIRIRKIQK